MRLSRIDRIVDETLANECRKLETVAPEFVVTDASTTMKQVKYGEIQWLVLAAVKELIAKVTDLANTVAK